MFRTLQKIGNSKGLVLTRDMLQHLGVSNAVDVSFENDRLVITAPRTQGQKQSFEDAMDSTIAQYGPALQRLSEPPDLTE